DRSRKTAAPAFRAPPQRARVGTYGGLRTARSFCRAETGLRIRSPNQIPRVDVITSLSMVASDSARAILQLERRNDRALLCRTSNDRRRGDLLHRDTAVNLVGDWVGNEPRPQRSSRALEVDRGHKPPYGVAGAIVA